MKIYKHVKDKKLSYQYERFKKVKISLDIVKKLSKISKENKIDFCVTPFDPGYVKNLTRYIKFFKVASGDINNIPLLKEISKTKKKLLSRQVCQILKKLNTQYLFLIKKMLLCFIVFLVIQQKNKDANLINIKKLKEKFN